MILSNVEIQTALDAGRLIIDPEPSPRSEVSEQSECPYQTSAVDLTLGSMISIYKGDTSSMVIDLTKGNFEGLKAVMESRTLTEDQPLVLAQLGHLPSFSGDLRDVGYRDRAVQADWRAIATRNPM